MSAKADKILEKFGANISRAVTPRAGQAPLPSEAPPDKYAGVTLAQQTAQLKTAYASFKKSGRVKMLVWFLVRDEDIAASSPPMARITVSPRGTFVISQPARRRTAATSCHTGTGIGRRAVRRWRR